MSVQHVKGNLFDAPKGAKIRGDLATRFKVKDLSGKVFGDRTVVSFSHMKQNKSYWNCICSCGSKRVLSIKAVKGHRKCSCIVKDDLYWAKRWIKRNLLRKGDRFRGRSALDLELVLEKALKAKEKFPYMSFKGKCKRAHYASFDRVDSTKDYSDINNIEIMPLWLNMAKVDLTIAELDTHIRSYLKT